MFAMIVMLTAIAILQVKSQAIMNTVFLKK